MNNNGNIVVNVYSTTNYDAFKMLEGNREILNTRVKKIRSSMEQKIVRNPIIVNEKMEIIDGQGRFTVLKEKGMPIEYVIVDGIGMQECHLLNQIQTNWTDMDFIKSYAQQGIQSYALLLRAIQQSGYSAKHVMRAANKSIGCYNNSFKKGEKASASVIRNGSLKFDENDYHKARRKLEMLDELKAALDLKKKVGWQFDCATLIIFDFDGYDHNRMLSKAEKKRNDFAVTSTAKEQAKEFSKIYNYRSHGNELYFEDYYRNKGKSVRNFY